MASDLLKAAEQAIHRLELLARMEDAGHRPESLGNAQILRADAEQLRTAVEAEKAERPVMEEAWFKWLCEQHESFDGGTITAERKDVYDQIANRLAAIVSRPPQIGREELRKAIVDILYQQGKHTLGETADAILAKLKEGAA